MLTYKAVVRATVGLHARPAATFVRAVTASGLPVTISKAGSKAVDARSLLHVMAADFHSGCEVELAINASLLCRPLLPGEAERALRILGELLESQDALQAVVGGR